MKYVVMQDEHGEETLFLCPNEVSHVSFAEGLIALASHKRGDSGRTLRSPVSAGFIGVDRTNLGVFCYGGSETLGLPSRPQDTDLLKSQIKI